MLYEYVTTVNVTCRGGVAWWAALVELSECPWTAQRVFNVVM